MGASLFLGICAFLWGWVGQPGGSEIWSGLVSGRTWLVARLEAVPLPLYMLAFAILPAFGAPLSVFYFTVATVFGGLGWGLLMGLAGIALNMSLVHWIGMGYGRPFAERLLSRRGMRVPIIQAENRIQAIVLVRLSPMPFFVQNYLLALGGLPFRTYLFWSMLLQGTLGSGVIVIGGSLLEGNFRYALLGAFGLLLVMVLLRTIRRRKTGGSSDSKENSMSDFSEP